jgi:hypothetical protein
VVHRGGGPRRLGAASSHPSCRRWLAHALPGALARQPRRRLGVRASGRRGYLEGRRPSIRHACVARSAPSLTHRKCARSGARTRLGLAASGRRGWPNASPAPDPELPRGRAVPTGDGSSPRRSVMEAGWVRPVPRLPRRPSGDPAEWRPADEPVAAPDAGHTARPPHWFARLQSAACRTIPPDFGR